MSQRSKKYNFMTMCSCVFCSSSLSLPLDNNNELKIRDGGCLQGQTWPRKIGKRLPLHGAKNNHKKLNFPDTNPIF